MWRKERAEKSVLWDKYSRKSLKLYGVMILVWQMSFIMHILMFSFQTILKRKSWDFREWNDEEKIDFFSNQSKYSSYDTHMWKKISDKIHKLTTNKYFVH